MNPWYRLALAIASVPLLAAPSAYGVYLYLVPESGPLMAGSAALGFELLYIGVNVLILSTPELRAYGRRVALAAVVTAVTFNTLAHYQLKVPLAFTGAPLAPLPAFLALITSMPLAGLAYAVSVLLHRLSDGASAAVPADSGLPVAHQETTINLLVAGSDGVSRTERVKQLAVAQGVSESTMWRRVKKQPELLGEVVSE